MTAAAVQNYLVVGAALFGLGAVGFLTRRNLIVMFLSAELMLQGVAVNLVAFGAYHRNYQGLAFVVFMLTVAACEAALALALILVLYRSRQTLDVSRWQDLREAGLDQAVDEGPRSPPVVGAPSFPVLTPAGAVPRALSSPEPLAAAEEAAHA